MKKTFTLLPLFILAVCLQNARAQIACTLNITYTAPSAFAACDATGSVTYSGPGTASLCPVTYTWVPGLYAGATINGLCAGTYTVYANFGGGPSCCGLTTGVVTIPNGPTSIGDLYLQQGIIIFDNATSTLKIKDFIRGNLSLNIFDITGKEIRSFSLNSDMKELNLSDLPTGLFFIELYFEREIIARQKIIRS